MNAITEALSDIPKQPIEVEKPVVSATRLQQPWRSVWPAKPNDNLPAEKKEDSGVPVYQLSGGRSAECGYNDEARVKPEAEKK